MNIKILDYVYLNQFLYNIFVILKTCQIQNTKKNNPFYVNNYKIINF